MNWHLRYIQQATWTHDLRAYLFGKAGLLKAHRVLEVGCGTGAILSTLSTSGSVFGLDLDAAALTECRVHTPTASLTRGDALSLPYPPEDFNITYCHYLLLWVKEPLHALVEMKRVTLPGGHVLALAEPDYTHRIDGPPELAVLGKWQSESLERQGADVGLGARLAELFREAGIRIVETGTLQRRGNETPTPEEREKEWTVLEADLAGNIRAEEIHRMKQLDKDAWERGERVLDVPTYFVWGQV